MVVQAYILIQTDVGKAAEVAAAITDIKGVILAEDVTGPYDVIVRAEARNVDELGKLVVAKVQTLDGITQLLLLDQPEAVVAAALDALGARRARSAAVGLDRAVNAFLAKNHAAPRRVMNPLEEQAHA